MSDLPTPLRDGENMNTPTDREGEARAQALSALADGELDEACLAALTAAWAGDGEARARWHAYQLIGDVLRSDELASCAEHDAAFLAALRQKLAKEPVVLAPAALDSRESTQPVVSSAAVRRRRRVWIGSSAVAAGFAMVVISTLAVRLPDSEGGAQLAQTAQPVAAPMMPAAVAPAAVTAVSLTPPREAVESAAPVLADAKLIRDARLDRYLAAHKQFSGSSVLGLPSAFLRDSASDAPSR